MNTLGRHNYFCSRCLLLILLVVQAHLNFAQAPSQATTARAQTEKLVAIADIHGAYLELTSLLVATALVNPDLHWTGGKGRLVIVGDVLDRGADARKALDLIMRLEQEAAQVGGSLHFVLGNHEIMNLAGDLSYVTAAGFSAYIIDENPVERAQAFQRFQAGLQTQYSTEQEALAAFDRSYPPGFFGHRSLFSPTGTYGKWLLSKPLVEVIDNTAFLHGGMAPAFFGLGAAELNQNGLQTLALFLDAQQQLIKAELIHPETDLPVQGELAQQAIDTRLQSGQPVAETLQEASRNLNHLLQTSDLFGGDGLTWYRGMVACSPAIEQSRVTSALQGLGVERLVIGHTPTPQGRVLGRFADKLIRADTGMLRPSFGGTPAAVIIENDILSVVYPDAPEITRPEPQLRQVGKRPFLMSDQELESLLLAADITSQAPAANGRTLVTLTVGERSVDALFTPAANQRRRQVFIPEVAAYRLDKMLDLEMVPVAVAREINGVLGALSLPTDDLMNEQQRFAGGLGATAWCPLQDQFNLMYIFDSLISNAGRSPDEMLYDPQTWQLVLTGNDDILDADKKLPAYGSSVTWSFSESLLEKLRALNAETLEASIGDVLGRSERQALLTRRNLLLDKATAE